MGQTAGVAKDPILMSRKRGGRRVEGGWSQCFAGWLPTLRQPAKSATGKVGNK